MNTTYWNLFWTTGMPEAWLMSRNEAERGSARDSASQGERPAPSGPLAGLRPRSDNSPGGPMGLY